MTEVLFPVLVYILGCWFHMVSDELACDWLWFMYWVVGSTQLVWAVLMILMFGFCFCSGLVFTWLLDVGYYPLCFSFPAVSLYSGPSKYPFSPSFGKAMTLNLLKSRVWDSVLTCCIEDDGGSSFLNVCICDGSGINSTRFHSDGRSQAPNTN